MRTTASSIAFAIPGCIIYFVVHLAFWPAQMSPDSLDQWQQLMTWRFQDWHPVSSTLLYWLFYQAVPSPAFAVFVQYVLFALATGYFLAELRNWGVALSILVAGAVLFPLVPPIFLVATTLWKDVPFATALIILTALLIRGVRLDFKLAAADWLAMGAAGVALVLFRHNGVIVSVGVFFLLLCTVRAVRLPASVLVGVQIMALVLSKTVLLSALAAWPQSNQERTIVALPMLAAMVRAGVPLTAEQEQTIVAIAPIEAWKSVPCGSVVPFYFEDPRLSHEQLDPRKVFAAAASLAVHNPLIALKQELCMTEIFWRPWSRESAELQDVPLEITQTQIAKELQLTTESKLPGLADGLRQFHDRYFSGRRPLQRPALYLLAGIIATVRLMMIAERRLWLAWLPAGLNCASLIFLIQSQEYRLVWPSVAASLLLTIFAIGAEAKHRHGLRILPAPEPDRQFG